MTERQHDQLAEARALLDPIGRHPIDSREFEWLYKLYLECLVVRSKGLREWNRLPPGMRLAVTSLLDLYPHLDDGRAIDFNAEAGQFVSNRQRPR